MDIEEQKKLEALKLKYDIVFYHMTGCYHCQTANEALDPLIQSGKIGKFTHNQQPPPGVQGFPHFVNNKNGKTVTGWPGSEEELFRQLGYIKENYDPKYDPLKRRAELKKENFDEAEREKCRQNCVTNKTILDITKKCRTCSWSCICNSICQNEKGAKLINFSKKFEMENSPSYPVVERMDTIPTDVLYRHQAGGYLPLNKCWVKQSDYTA